MTKAQTLKGFRDFLPKEARKRQYVIRRLAEVFESYGFEPLETPALEYEEILLGKYGEEGDKLMYRFEDNGKRKVAMRYDQTVPLTRVVAEYGNELPMPFKRYQIQNVWRAENTQKGRFREFLQCDIDTVGVTSPLSDAEIITIVLRSLKQLGFKNYKIIINDRNIFSNLIKREIFSEKTMETIIRAMDKLKKIGRGAVLEEMIKKGIPSEQATYAIQTIEQTQPTENLQKIFALLIKLGVNNSQFEFSPTLARGLDYYTGIIFEVEVLGYEAGSVAGGGRYDKLIGMFAEKAIPAVGVAFGFDRLMEAMEQLNLFPTAIEQSSTTVLATIFSPELLSKSIEVCSQLRSNNISCELYLDQNSSLDKQLKYADKKNVPYALIIGPDEIAKNLVTLKNMKTREQNTLPISDINKLLLTS